MDYRYLVGFISEWLGAISVAWLLSLSPRFRKPPIGFQYARRDGIVALSLYVLILIFAFAFFTLNPPIYRQPFLPAPAPVIDLTQALLLAAISLAAFGVALATRRQPIRSAGWNPAVFTPALQMGLAIAVLTLFLRNRVMQVLAGGFGPDGLRMLTLAIGVSLAEETIFRGYIQMRLSWWLGQWPGIVLTAVMFTLWSATSWLPGLDSTTIALEAALTFAQGLVLGWVMYKSGHVAAPALYRAFSIWVQLLP